MEADCAAAVRLSLIGDGTDSESICESTERTKSRTSNLNGFQSEQPRPSRHRRTDSQTDSIVSTASTIPHYLIEQFGFVSAAFVGSLKVGDGLNGGVAQYARTRHHRRGHETAAASSYEQFNDMIDIEEKKEKEKEAAPDYDYNHYYDYEEEEKTMYVDGRMSMVNEYQYQATPEPSPACLGDDETPSPPEVDDGDHDPRV